MLELPCEIGGFECNREIFHQYRVPNHNQVLARLADDGWAEQFSVPLDALTLPSILVHIVRDGVRAARVNARILEDRHPTLRRNAGPDAFLSLAIVNCVYLVEEIAELLATRELLIE